MRDLQQDLSDPAIRYEDYDEYIEVDVGAIVVATARPVCMGRSLW
jgi:heterodisulfide reductase subunit A-like polyferredoxin